jgi:hypothetical protein
MTQSEFEYTQNKNKFYFDVHDLEISNWIYTDDDEDTSKRKPQPISVVFDLLVIFDANNDVMAEITPSHRLYNHYREIIVDLIQYDYDFIKAKLGE